MLKGPDNFALFHKTGNFTLVIYAATPSYSREATEQAGTNGCYPLRW